MEPDDMDTNENEVHMCKHSRQPYTNTKCMFWKSFMHKHANRTHPHTLCFNFQSIAEPSSELTPRHLYFARLEESGQLPWPAVLRRSSSPKEINIAGLGLGDQVIMALAAVLPQLPSLEVLNVRDNRLTDDSLIPLCKAIISIHQMKSVDLSENKMDEVKA